MNFPLHRFSANNVAGSAVAPTTPGATIVNVTPAVKGGNSSAQQPVVAPNNGETVVYAKIAPKTHVNYLSMTTR